MAPATVGVGRWLDVDEAAARLRMSRRALYMAIRRGQIPVHRLGRRLRFDPVELDAALLRV